MNTSPSLTVILWESPSHMSEASLFGRPLWHRTLESIRPLGPDSVLFVSNRRDVELDGIRKVTRRQLVSALKEAGSKVLLLPAELPCIRTRTLKRLISSTRSVARVLTDGETTSSTAVYCCQERDLKTALRSGKGNGFPSLRESLQPTPLAPVSADELVEIRGLADLAEANGILRRRKCEKLLASGVRLDDPTTVHIDPEVRVGKGTRIRGWVVIEGESRVGSNCDIGCFCHIVDTEIGANTILLDHCFVRSSRIGKAAQLGPFAHLRPDSVLENHTKVGNFVELKKTVLGRGSKAPHLTYLGDTNVGEKVNVGAGTITCNYDGHMKHQTVIEDGAFIGSDVQLVAPVRVGKGAYVAAGSCVVADVPAQSLALARSRQVVKQGWAKQIKKRKSKQRP